MHSFNRMDLTEQHKRLLRHTIGLKKDGDVSYRNYYVAGEGHDQMPALNELLAHDYMAVRDNPGGSGYLFRATDKGREAVGAGVKLPAESLGVPAGDACEERTPGVGTVSIHACPVCGMPLMHSCFHDGDDVQAVDMEPTRAAKILRETISEMEERIDQYKEALRRVES